MTKRRFDVWNHHGRRAMRAVTAEIAAAAIGVSTEEFEWAIEEHGRCDCEIWTAVEWPSNYPKPMED